MIIKFQKYRGAGNDFIIIDNRQLLYDFPVPRVEQLCNLPAAKKPPCAETADGRIVRFTRRLEIFEKHTVLSPPMEYTKPNHTTTRSA